jgi:hypothetical protein
MLPFRLAGQDALLSNPASNGSVAARGRSRDLATDR